MIVDSYYSLVSVLAPASLIVYALICLWHPMKGSKQAQKNASNIGLISILTSLASVLILLEYGTIQSSLLGIEGLGFSVRLDALSVTMLSMISLLAFVILKFSKNYMEGDPRKRIFFCRLSITIAAVQLLILAGNLFQILVFWTITSICLHYLLVFYRERPQAIAAARKKFVVARIGDLTLLISVILLYTEFGTGDLRQIFESIQTNTVFSNSLGLITILLVITAAFKSAQFPSHGWLIEVVETPTPVSALLHAGLLNAGPFLMVRLAYLMAESTSASLLLIVIGGSTSILASVIYLTQSSVKVSLGYSSIAHMGFSLLLCGLGIYSAAVLHIVAHSFYKAHAFLSSGSAVERNQLKRISLRKRGGDFWQVVASVFIGLSLYITFSNILNIDLVNEFNLFVVGIIIALGISQISMTTIQVANKWKSVFVSVGMMLLVIGSFFLFEHGARTVLGSQIPALEAPDTVIRLAVVSLIILYAIVMFIQLFAFKIQETSFAYRWSIHLRNGLYANIVFDRMVGSLKNEKFKWVNLSVQENSNEVSAPLETDMVLPEKEVFISN